MSASPPAHSLPVTDQLGRRIVLPYPPQRIVSLVPSQTELLFDLGLGARVVGVTKFCVHPAAARQQAAVIGGTKQFDFAKIHALQPDLLIGNKEENYQAGIAELAQRYPVWVSDIADLPAALAMIEEIGALTGVAAPAATLATTIDQAFAALPALGPPIPAAYFIWRRPYMVAAGGTFIDDMLRRAGFANVFGALGRYPEVSPEQLQAAAPTRIFLSSEPYPFKEKHLAEFQAICPAARVQVVDGELFSWYGSRLLQSAAYFSKLAKSYF
ncbi:ABC transporter substrate-binding protein [Hymenobacter sp. RP-2-7]|uniref:ABC transporter substrate-binding protein n=1 Tax=Hymenobacter polaris TaxID=2682546 RepID=A0A7Y0AB26_9BACT|nr:helical backbone metal receptor [Hymenobacter polaris]NML64075.1 ABC transporter substrate-binding protein [Hymenobacter polaris]